MELPERSLSRAVVVDIPAAFKNQSSPTTCGPVQHLAAPWSRPACCPEAPRPASLPTRTPPLGRRCHRRRPRLRGLPHQQNQFGHVSLNNFFSADSLLAPAANGHHAFETKPEFERRSSSIAVLRMKAKEHTANISWAM
ncbi:hypothetical protein INR49_005757 [Caranx melampygus]|nr:hypothetical protein INR49_005757 [Caranx melampygus]